MDQGASSIEEIFSRALELPAGGRAAFLAAQCDGDPELRREAESLLEAHNQAGSFLDPAAEPPPVLPGYRIERKIGEGSLGVVYAARDEKLGRMVALKVLRPQADRPALRRALDEARRAAALTDPAIVTIYSVLDEADPPAIVMELVEGFPIDRAAESLGFGQKARLLRGVARGLAAAHAGGLVHRDLKPENILAGPDLRPRILDFGLALPVAEAGRPRGGFEGTPLYASPEQALGQPLGPASDVFSFGSVMFKVLTGRTPFQGGSVREVLQAIAAATPPFPRDAALGLPEDLQAICLSCLASNPSDRPTASEIALELGRFLAGEPTRLRPKLYGDLLRRSLSEQSGLIRHWESQGIISKEERDSFEVLHRRLLTDEDHWIIEARRITPRQTVLSAGAWLAVVAAVLSVWLLRDELGPPWRWAFPGGLTLGLLAAGHTARRAREIPAAAAFLAAAALAVAPSLLTLLAEFHLFASTPPGVSQLFQGVFTNQQVLASSVAALAVSVFGLWRLKMTGFAWTTAALAVSSYLGLLMVFGWLDQKPEVKALWCLPLGGLESVAILLERKGRVRWTLPFHLAAITAVVAGLDVMALGGPTLKMLGITARLNPYFDDARLRALSIVMNGALFLASIPWLERSGSLDLRRTGKIFEVLAVLHLLSALFVNALNHQNDPLVRVDVSLYLALALLLVVLAPLRSRWRLLVGGLAGCGLGSYLLASLGLVPRRAFILGLGCAGLAAALGAFAQARRRQAGTVPRRGPEPGADPKGPAGLNRG